MPSPFPGMDPYLESPRWFHGLHINRITYLEEQFQPRLPSPYSAQSGQNVWLELSQRFSDRARAATRTSRVVQGGHAVKDCELAP
jgi:hypothetical protein